MADENQSKGFWTGIPLYIRIVGGLIIGLVIGTIIYNTSMDASGNLLPMKDRSSGIQKTMQVLGLIGELLLRLLQLIALPLIMVAVVRAILTADIQRSTAGRLVYLLSLNTLVAIIIGITVANVVQPGRHEHLKEPPGEERKDDMIKLFSDQIPRDIFSPFITKPMSNKSDSFVPNSIGVILIAVTIGLVGRGLATEMRASLTHASDIGFHLTVGALHYIIQLVPFAVMAKVAYILGEKGYAPFQALGWFILSVLLALFLQASYYLIRVKIGSWVHPIDLIRGTRDALVMAFSTASSTATMPVTYDRLKSKVGLRERSASLGSLVGSNFNNDGTALYEAMSALFISQMIGQDLSLTEQLLVVITSVIAGVGAAGIPEAGLVTMALVFNAVNLPTGYILLLLPVDWFLDRCRTTINVMGDMNVSCLLDGKTRESRETPRSEIG